MGRGWDWLGGGDLGRGKSGSRASATRSTEKWMRSDQNIPCAAVSKLSTGLDVAVIVLYLLS